MGLREKAVVGLLTGILFALFYSATKTNYDTLALDSAYMVELIDTTYEYHVPRTHLTKSVILAITNLLWTPPDRICASPLAPETAEYLDVFERHSFPVLYLMAPFHLLFQSKSIVFFANTMAFIGFLLVVYIALRSSGVPVALSLIFTGFVSAHPAWSRSAFGQFYPDRYFPPLGLIYLCLLHRRLVGKGPPRTAGVLAAGILAAATTERAALTIGIFTIAILIAYRSFSKWRREDLPIVGLAVGAMVYALLYMALVQRNSDYASFRNSVAYFLTDILNKPHYRDLLIKFLVVNVVLFGVVCAFEWRMGLIAAAAMLPNLFGTNGGAEKTGWSTHYHSIYFPFLVAAALFGFVSLWKAARNSRWRHLVVAIPIILGSSLALLDPYSSVRYFDFSTKNLRDYAILKTLEFQTNTGPAASVIFFSKLAREVAGSVPPASEVTTTEFFMPALYGERLIHFYPLGLMSSDYAVLPYSTNANGTKRFTGAVSYLGPDATNALDDCLNKRLQSAGYSSVRDFPLGGGSGIAVLKRGQPGAADRD